VIKKKTVDLIAEVLLGKSAGTSDDTRSKEEGRRETNIT